jgi:hypothetical protein
MVRRTSGRLSNEEGVALELSAKVILPRCVQFLRRPSAVYDGAAAIGSAHNEEQVRRQQAPVLEPREPAGDVFGIGVP